MSALEDLHKRWRRHRDRAPERGGSVRTAAVGVKVSVGVVHKSLTEARPEAQDER